MKFATVRKMAVGVGTVASLLTSYYYMRKDDGNIVFASWTTNYEPNPAAKWDSNWDHRDPKVLTNPKKLNSLSTGDNDYNEQLEKRTAKAVRHIILVRHGQYNTQGLTDDERVLTEIGRKQAELTGLRLKELGIPFTEIIKSTMARAQETGTLISKSLPDIPVKNCDFIREGAPIPPEPPIGNWRSEVHDGARIEAGFRKYFHRADPSQEKDSYTLLVCHANVIRYFVCRALQFPGEAWLRISLNHGSITWVTIAPSGRVYLRALGESGHLPPHLITTHP